MKKKTTKEKSKSLIDLYDEECRKGNIDLDPPQRDILASLQKIYDSLEINRSLSFFSKNSDVKGLYIWGDVGRGKTYLMDLFYSQIENTPKRRIHFHEFMKEVHATLHQLNNSQEEALPVLIKQIASEVTLLCLDEFQVTNIADAMLMARLFEGLFREGVVLVSTSNTSPANLYEKGLHRERFLPFIPLLSEYNDIAYIPGDIDYRRQKFSGQKLYFSPCNEESMNKLRAIWDDLTENAPLDTVLFTKVAPPLTLEGLSRGVAWAHFQDLCAQPCGRLAYLSLAESIHTLILWGIPQMKPEDHNEAVRFTILIDILYDKGVWLAAAGDVEPEYLYQQGGSFDRTISRLYEMQHG